MIEGLPRDLANLEDEISGLRGELRAICEKIDEIKRLYEEWSPDLFFTSIVPE